MKQLQSQQTYLSLWVFALWGTGLAIGVFGILQVARVKDLFRALSYEAVEVTSRFSQIEQFEERILESTRELLKAGADGVFEPGERELLKKFHRETLFSLTHLKSAISDIEEKVDAKLYSTPGGVAVQSSTKLILAELKAHRERADKLLVQLEEPSPDVSALNDARDQANEIQRILRLVDQEAEKVLVLFASESIEHAQAIEQAVVYQLSFAALFGLALGAFIIYRIHELQQKLIDAERLGVLGKLAISLQHEINNPLSVIVGNAYLLRSSKSSEAEKTAALEAVQSSAQVIAAVLKRTEDMEKVVTTEYVGGVEMIDLSSSSHQK